MGGLVYAYRQGPQRLGKGETINITEKVLTLVVAVLAGGLGFVIALLVFW